VNLQNSIQISGKPTFRSLPRKRESRNTLKILDSCLLQPASACFSLLHACFMPASCLCKNYGITSLGAFPKISTLAL